MSKVYKIYLVTNTVSGKRYVGVTRTTTRQRLLAHRGDGPMAEDIQRLGYEMFEIEVIDQRRTKEAALAREAELILELGTHVPDGYNGQVRGMRYPGRGGPPEGNTNSKRTSVVQLTMDGQQVETYDTVMAASAATGVDRGAIHRAMKNYPHYSAGLFLWRRF